MGAGGVQLLVVTGLPLDNQPTDMLLEIVTEINTLSAFSAVMFFRRENLFLTDESCVWPSSQAELPRRTGVSYCAVFSAASVIHRVFAVRSEGSAVLEECPTPQCSLLTPTAHP